MQTKIYGHRGMMGTYPENSLKGYKAGLDIGVDGFECDVHLTKDNEIVVTHDETIDRVTNGSGTIKNLTLEEIKSYNLVYKGQETTEKIPTLAELLDLLNNYKDIDLNIEMKTTEISYKHIEKKVIEETQKCKEIRNIIFSSFHLPTLIRIKEIEKTAKIALLIQTHLPFIMDYKQTLNLESLHLGRTYLNRLDEIDPSKVRFWTINKEKELEQLLNEKVAAIITDYPEKALILRDKKHF